MTVSGLVSLSPGTFSMVLYSNLLSIFNLSATVELSSIILAHLTFFYSTLIFLTRLPRHHACNLISLSVYCLVNETPLSSLSICLSSVIESVEQQVPISIKLLKEIGDRETARLLVLVEPVNHVFQIITAIAMLLQLLLRGWILLSELS